MAKSGAQQKLYKMTVQKKGIHLYNQHNARAVPSTANPVSNPEPGLGAKTLVHPFLAGKKSI